MKSLLLIIGVGILGGFTLSVRAEEPESKTQELIESALTDFEAKKYDSTLAKLMETEKFEPHSSFVLNLIGATYTKKKDFAKAKASFEEALALQPDFFPAMFNIGELFFLQKQYPQALTYFVKMSNANPNNELLQFKVVVCLLLTDQQEEAAKLAKRMKFPGDTPAWYFSQAAVQMKSGDKGKARGFQKTAESIFPGQTAIYTESFADLGWPTK